VILEINGKELDFHQLLENSATAKFVLEGHKIIYANRACLKLLKLKDSTSLLNQDYFTFLHHKYHAFCDKSLKEVLEEKKTLGPVEIQMIDTDGKTIVVESKMAIFYLGDETLVQVIIQDITERKEIQKRLIQSEKLAIMGELATGIVHEIRNPLTIIKGFTDLLNNETSKKGKDYLAIMKKELERVEALATDLLLFAKPHEQLLKPANLSKLMNDVMILLGNLAKKSDISIHFVCNDEYIKINCDEGYLKQALINLIKNAIEATPKKGTVDVTIKNDGNNATITISDTGCGMSYEQIKKIGTSFYSTKENGTGLGLMISYNIIKNHHGSIKVKSEEGKGTTFTINIPELRKSNMDGQATSV
jgi:PAS domain S-box-containing protein